MQHAIGTIHRKNFLSQKMWRNKEGGGGGGNKK